MVAHRGRRGRGRPRAAGLVRGGDVAYFTGQLDAYAALEGAGRAAIDRGNASALFPKP
jgi:hypothetical protein